jgi:hypothetical protein
MNAVRIVVAGLLALTALGCGHELEPGTAEPAEARQELVHAPADPTCALLEDPEIRMRMSGAFESRLLRRCAVASGRQTPATKLEGRVGPRPEGEQLLQLAGTDVLVNDPALDVGGTTQSETSMVAVGNVVCAAWNDSGEGFGANGFSGHGVSLDGGATFSDGGPFPNGPGDSNGGDPSLAYSARDGAFYYAALSDIGLSLWRSVNSCQSFTYVGPIHAGTMDDKQLMAVDNTPASPFYGRIYVGWTNFAASPDSNMAVFSDDGGVNWSAPAPFPGSGPNGQGVFPAVAPNGDVYMALLNRSFVVGGLQDQWIYRSSDGGNSWQKQADIGTGQLRPENDAASTACGRQALNGDIRNLSSPQIAISNDAGAPSGYVIHAVYPYDSDGPGPDHSNVFYRRSLDGAATWSAELLLNDDGTATDQFFPAIGVSENGAIVASWYDRRLDPMNNLLFDRFLAFSVDGGLSWSANERISDVSSPVAETNPNFDGLATCYHGDYDEVSVVGNIAHIVWSDDRRITASGPNPDVYYDQFVINPSLGRLRANVATISCESSLSFTLMDQDLEGTGTQPISIETSNGDLEILVLTEDPGRAGTFLATIATAPAAVVPGNGVLEIEHGATIVATYDDADDGQGNPAVATAEVNADCQGPVIDNVRVESVRGRAASVAVDTSEPANLVVEYGLFCAALTESAASDEFSTTPVASLVDLFPSTTYFFVVTATDRFGNESRDDNGGSCYSFETLDLIFEEDFEGGLGGFTIDNGFGRGNGLWHASQACAATEFGHSVPTALYYGQDSTCDYDIGVEHEGVALSPVISVSDTSALVIELNYFLGTEFSTVFDRASVEVSVDGGPFQVVESSFTTLTTGPDFRPAPPVGPAGMEALVPNSGSWRHATVDITSLVEGLGEADIQLRLHFDTVDASLNDFAGFYVDDVEVFGAVPPEPCSSAVDCDDGLFCNGAELCSGGFCARGLPVVCTSEDGVACTDEVCDEDLDACVSRPNDGNCGDGLACNGREMCDPLSGCRPATEPLVCAPDAVACTVETCVEVLKGCSPVGNDELCDDASFCTGFESCNEQTGCVSSGNPCNDFNVCTTDVCNDETETCSFVPDDDVPPVFSFVPPDITTTTCASPDIGQATALDDCGVSVTNNAPAQFVPGTTLVTWTATDPAGNATTATQRVTLVLTDNSACCPAGTHVLVGTSSNNTLSGTSGSDCILGRGGQDTLNGGGGVDYLSGGDGNDAVSAGDGNDVVFGGSGQDTLNGGNGDDNLNGGDVAMTAVVVVADVARPHVAPAHGDSHFPIHLTAPLEEVTLLCRQRRRCCDHQQGGDGKDSEARTKQ